MPSEVPVDRWEGVDGLQFVGQAYPTHALLDSSPVSMRWPIHTGDILRLKALVYNVCTVRTSVVIHKQKFSTPKQTYMLFQNDIPIDMACHRYTLNTQISSGTMNNSSGTKRAILHHRNGVVQWCSLGGNRYLALSMLKSGEKLNLDS
ncbi:uncharacterized protein TNCV_4807441 [Trichonephila clavipes]|nr:uncharacterized protein TNCV_4807441 [Trichonephila clavipes]